MRLKNASWLWMKALLRRNHKLHTQLVSHNQFKPLDSTEIRDTASSVPDLEEHRRELVHRRAQISENGSQSESGVWHAH
jgi:hypothetical protein